MSATSPRVGFILPDDNDFVLEDDFNANSTKLDKSLGVPWVTDGTLPEIKFHGAPFRELTSGKEYTLKSDGLGGYTKVEPFVATVNHYTKNIGAVTGDNITAPANGWSTVANGSATWIFDRPAYYNLRVNCDVTPHVGANSVKFRLSGFTNSETPAIFPPNGRQTTQINFHGNRPAGSFTFNLDFYNFTAAGNSVLQALAYHIDTIAVLT